jgi:hypothetical protein
VADKALCQLRRKPRHHSWVQTQQFKVEPEPAIEVDPILWTGKRIN